MKEGGILNYMPVRHQDCAAPDWSCVEMWCRWIDADRHGIDAAACSREWLVVLCYTTMLVQYANMLVCNAEILQC